MFPTLYDQNYSPTVYTFRVSSAQRIIATFMAFAEGLFGENARDNIPIPQEETIDTMLLTVYLKIFSLISNEMINYVPVF